MEETENLLVCKCGSVLFTQEVAATFDNSKFIIYAGGSPRLTSYDNTIPYAKCLCCGRVSVPRTSFNGRNRLDRIVQVYEQLLLDVEKINAKIEIVENRAYHSHYGEVPSWGENVETESDSGTSVEDVVQSGIKRAGRKQNNKK